MSDLKQATCPSCGTVLSYRSNRQKVAINCGKCSHLFEIQNPNAVPTPNSRTNESVNPRGERKPVLVTPISEADSPNPTPRSPNQPITVEPIEVQPIDVQHDAQPTGNSRFPLGDSRTPIPVRPVDPTSQSRPEKVKPLKRPAGRRKERTPPAIPIDDRSSGATTVESEQEIHADAPELPKPIIKKDEAYSKSARRVTKGFKIVGLTIGGVALLTSLAAILLTSLNYLTPSHKGRATQLASAIDTFHEITVTADRDDGRKWAIRRLNELTSQVDKLLVDLANMQTMKPNRGAMIRESLSAKQVIYDEALQAGEELSAGFPAHELLVITIDETQAAIDAALNMLNSGLHEIPAADSKAQRQIREGMLLQRELIHQLMAIETNDSLVEDRDSMHSLADQLNAAAERCSIFGKPNNPYAASERCKSCLRDWIIHRLESKVKLDAESRYLIQDLCFVWDRFELALESTQSVSMLTSNSEERVQEMMAGRESNELLLARRELNGADSAQVADSVQVAPANRVPGKGGSSQDQAQTKSSSDPLLANPKPPEASSTVSSAPRADGNTGEPPLASSTDLESDPFGVEIALPATSGDKQNAFDPARDLAAPRYTGNSSLTIRVFNAEHLRSDLLCDRLGRLLRARDSMHSQAGDQLMLNFVYSGDLPKVLRFIDFGSIDLTDSQSRTIYVTAEQ